MDPLIAYTFPVKGLKAGVHRFDFQVDRAFFQAFEGSPVEDGNVQLTLYFDKRPTMVGTFYRASAPGAKPLVELNQTVAEGDRLCIVEAMKLMNEIESEFSGTVKSSCDRCLEIIDLPIADRQQLLVKFDEVEEEDAEVVYIHPDTDELSVAKWAYEFICLAIPISRRYDCENDLNAVCNQEVLKYLRTEDADTESPEEPPRNPIWDVLKDLNNN